MVHFSLVGFGDHPTWNQKPVELDVIPREGEVVDFPGMPEGQVYVRTVVHSPWGDRNKKGGPFVYIVLGPPRP